MKLNIRLFPARNKTNVSGKSPIRCRITYNKQRKEFSTGLFINPDHWNSKKQKALVDAEHSEYTNTQLSLIINKMNQAFLLLQIQRAGFTVIEIYSLYKGEKLKKEFHVVEYFELFLEDHKRLIGIDIVEATWKKFYYVKQHLKAYIKHKYGKNDYLINDLVRPVWIECHLQWFFV